MAGGPAWSRRVALRARGLRALLRDTRRALHDAHHVVGEDPEISLAVQEIGDQSLRSTALVILGTTPSARARLLHSLLGRKLLPDPPPRGGRWVRIQYGSSTQVHLSLGNSEFELVEELECNKRAWETLPVEDLIRQDQTDLTTILEVELNNQFLKDGLKIILPPDLDADPGLIDHLTLKKLHSDLYTKRSSILSNVNPIYLYCIDRMGKNIFSDVICASIASSRSEEDFWNNFSLYHMNQSVGDRQGDSQDVETSQKQGIEVISQRVVKSTRMRAVFSGENCLDLHQVKELNPNAQLLFFLFADSEDMDSSLLPRERPAEATESTEEPYRSEELPESDQGLLKEGILRHVGEMAHKASCDNRRLYEEQNSFMNDLLDQWEMMTPPPPKHHVKSQWAILEDKELSDKAPPAPHKRRDDDRTLRSRPALFNTVVKFASDVVHASLLQHCIRLSEVHVRVVQRLVLSSFQLARELQVVPRRVQYVAQQEQLLFETMNEKFSEGEKKQELLNIMQEVLQEMKVEVANMDWSVDDLPCHQDRRFIMSNSTLCNSARSSPEYVSLRMTDRTIRTDAEASDSEEAVSYDSYNFDDYEIIGNDESFCASESFGALRESDEVSPPFNSIRVENEPGMLSFSAALGTATASTSASANTNTSTRASTNPNPSPGACPAPPHLSFKQASLDVQQTVLSKLSRKISLKLVKFMDCLKETYFGTLQRCLQSLERSSGQQAASTAARRLLGAARSVDLRACAQCSLLRSVLDSLRRLLYRLRLVGGETEQACCVLSPVWRRRVALHTVESLSPQRLARLISTQILEEISIAHEKYQSALSSLETVLAGKLHHTEDVKLSIRKKYAPSFARLCLESTSMCDLLQHGTPELGREIGRGQYGVVYSVRGAWAGQAPVAVKSVLPADDKHYHELAMEFFYTRSIPAHPRIVRLCGSLVQRGGAGPAVLLVSARRARDLHAAVRAGLAAPRRMRVALDIVEGIRYLHSLGLVHRDIKMKNVLLDGADRAALSDLGFCAAEALMSGSVVGTPVHMAPELLAGEYDASVDVYAFGILFWYVCAGNVKLPLAFEAFQNKEQLWSKVKRGLRPERLPHFSDECWEVMESCWASEPSQRAHLGDIQPKLERILQQAIEDEAKSEPCLTGNRDPYEDESLDITGI